MTRRQTLQPANSERHSREGGFTLIEMLVVTALSVIILIGASSLFLSSLVSSAHKDTVTAVKQEGDFAVGQMEFLLRNAISIEPNPSAPGAPYCTQGMKSITFREQDNGVSTLGIVNNKIASSSGNLTVYLTSDSINLNTQDPIFDCQQMANAGGYINIHFTLSAQNTNSGTPNAVSQTFTTSVNLRSF